MKYRPFFVAWWHKSVMGAIHLSSPHWHSCQPNDKRGADGAIGMVACVMASSEEQARLAVWCAYDRVALSDIEFRPCLVS